jgi:glycosyltransferase involved in cell wall biosynthesis
MINFERIVPLVSKAAGDHPVLAALYPLPSVVCRDLVSKGFISGYVGDTNRVSRDPFVAGWWIDRRAGSWFLGQGPSRSIVLLGAQSGEEISSVMLFQARLKGYDRILLAAHDGAITLEIHTASTLWRRLWSLSIKRRKEAALYESAFADMYTLLGDRLRLSERAFDPERIVIFTGSLQAGGAERQATNTALGLAKRWPGKVHVARSYEGGASDFYKPMLDAAGIPTHVVSEDEEYFSPGIMHVRNKLESRYLSLGFLDIFYMIFNHALLIQTLKPGLVHTFQDYSNILAGIAADLVGVPRLVLSGRSLAPENFEIFQPYMAPGYHTLLGRRDVVFLNNSEAGAIDYARWLDLPRKRFRVIRNGFEFPLCQAYSRSAQRQMLGIPDSAVLVGSVIGFREEKRPQLFLEIAQALRTTNPSAHFVIFGDGPLLGACRNFVASQNLSEFVHLPGATDNAWQALGALDIFVLTSRLEGLPNVLIEAQAMGLPVVCNGAGGMLDTFINGETGYSVPADTAEGFAKSISRLIDDETLRARMGEAAMRHARMTFDMSRMVNSTIEAYRSAPVSSSSFVPDWKYVNAPDEIRIGGAIKEEGHCFVGELPIDTDLSGLYLWEDDHELGPNRAEHADVRVMGGGRYFSFGRKILFSSSDHSDVRFNGRAYRLRPEHVDPDFDEVAIKSEVITSEIGHCYIAHLRLGDGSGRFSLWENDMRLGPGACLHDEIRAQGKGTYCVWGPDLYFSASDNSDPRINKRTYLLRRGRRFEHSVEKSAVWRGAPLNRALHRMLGNAVPRKDFVPGRIVHVIGNLGPGGAERQAYYTLRGLLDKSFESVQLLAYYLAAAGDHRHDFYVPTFNAAGIPVRVIRRQSSDDDPGRMPPSIREVHRALPPGLASDISDLFWEFINLRPAVVHAWLDGNNVRAGLAAALAGVPRIIISGRNVNPTHMDYLHEPCMGPIYKALLELPQTTMVNNSYAGRDDYARWLAIEADRIPVIHNGCSLPNTLSADAGRKARQMYSIPSNAIVVGTVTRLSEEKQPSLFIELAHRALQRQPNLHFLLFGNGILRDELEALIAKRELSDSVKLMGVTDNIWVSLAAMDVFVLTSRFEGLPNVLIEAQCAGIPVVSTAVGGAPETFVHGKTGFCVEKPTPEAMAEAALHLARNPKLRTEMSAAAAAFACKEFSVTRMIERTLELYSLAPKHVAVDD